MNNRFNKYFPPLFIFLELLVLTAMFFFSLFIATGSFALQGTYTLGLVFSVIIWSLKAVISKDYTIGRAVSYYYTLRRAFSTVFLFVAIVSIFWLFFGDIMLERHFLTTFILLLFLWISIYRVTVHLVLDRYRAFGGNIRKAVIVGYDKLGFNLFNLLKKRPQYGIRVLGFFSAEKVEEVNNRYPLLGSKDEIDESIFEELDFIYLSNNASSDIRNKIIEMADHYLVKVKLLPDIKLDVLKTLVLRKYEHISIIDLNNLPLDNIFNRIFKRGFDIVFALTIIISVLSWLYPILWFLIKLESKGPAIFKQKRHGKDNSVFWCYKFRTMKQNEEADSKWATKDDYRITKLGSFLRRTSLDELPQFFNVLLGQMSIVGPRPHPIRLNESYQNRVQKYAKRHSFKPGITGLAQSMGFRGEISQLHQMNSRVRLDRFYLENWSFWLDLKIIIMTVVSLYKGQRLAY